MSSRDSQGSVGIDLSEGDDIFTGGPFAETVYAGLGNDVVDTRGGADVYFAHEGPYEEAALASRRDRVTLGAGNDRAFPGSSSVEDELLDGGSGFNTLVQNTDYELDLAWVVDNVAQVATVDGGERFRWQNFQAFSLLLHGSLRFHGSDASVLGP